MLLVGVGPSDLDDVRAFEDHLAIAVAAVNGEVDGCGVGHDGVELFVYRSDVAAARRIVEDALRNSPFEGWELFPTGVQADDEDDGSGDADLPAVQVRRVTVPPSWPDDAYVALSSSQDGTIDGELVVGVFDVIRRAAGCEPQPGPSSASPLFTLLEPLERVDGTFDPWSVHGPDGTFESSCLPTWLLTAPSRWQMSMADARQAMWVDAAEAELEHRKQLRDLRQRADSVLTELRDADVHGVVWLWENHTSLTRCRS